MKGLIHIYCGDGKGKTTSAIGLGIRGLGSGMSVVMVQFLKTGRSSELTILRDLPNFTVIPCEKSFGFFSKMNEEKKEEAKNYYTNLLTLTLNHIKENKVDMLILDEIMAVTQQYELVNKDELYTFLKNKPENLEVVMTGRNPSKELLELSDYVSEINKIKHPFDQGIMARVGIEM